MNADSGEPWQSGCDWEKYLEEGVGRQTMENPSRLAMIEMKEWEVWNVDFGKPWKDDRENFKRVGTLQNAKESEKPVISCSKSQEGTHSLTNPQQQFPCWTTCKVSKFHWNEIDISNEMIYICFVL